MRPDFKPLLRNPHLLTIAGNFWPRKIDERQFPGIRTEYRIDERTAVVAIEHQPAERARAQLILLHGLEGSAAAGYLASFTQAALLRNLGVHRLNMRTCGGTEELCETMYHSGLTSDTLEVIKRLAKRSIGPIYIVGFSLGGNVALKLAGELGATTLLAGVVAISTPIDLAAAVRAIDKPINVLYARRFLERLRGRVRRKSRISPDHYTETGLDQVKTIWEFDDRFTAPLFGFGTAANYYATQSAINFLPTIRVPTLVITAKDDPLVPFETYRQQVFETNPALTLVATERGGHLGFLARGKVRFWLDGYALDWIDRCISDRSDESSTKSKLKASKT